MEKVLKILFIPVSVATAIVAGIVARKAFDLAWGQVADEEAPHPKQREARWLKLAAALVIEGAIFRLVKGLTDRAARSGFAHATGTWPGEQRAERE
jgi:hypothetical protein